VLGLQDLSHQDLLLLGFDLKTCRQGPSCGAAQAGYGWLALARHKASGNMFTAQALGHVSLL